MNRYLNYSDTQLEYYLNTQYPERANKYRGESGLNWIKAFITYNGYFPDLYKLTASEERFTIPNEFIPIKSYSVDLEITEYSVEIESMDNAPVLQMSVFTDGKVQRHTFKCAAKTDRFYISYKQGSNLIKSNIQVINPIS